MILKNGAPQALIGDGELVPLIGGLVPNTLADDKAFEKAVASATFLPRVQLFGSNSGAVKDEKIAQGRFGLVRGKDTIEDLSKSFTCVPLDWRWKAMQITEGNIVSVFDFHSADFKKLQHTADNTKDSGCMWGVEFLIWLPDQSEFATFYLSSASARKEAKPIRGLIGYAATLKSELITKGKFKWHVPLSARSLTPCATPAVDEMNTQIDKFRKSSVPAKTADAGGEDTRDR